MHYHLLIACKDEYFQLFSLHKSDYMDRNIIFSMRFTSLLAVIIFTAIEKSVDGIASKYDELKNNEQAMKSIQQYNNKAIKTIEELKDQLAKDGFAIGRAALIRYLKRIKV